MTVVCGIDERNGPRIAEVATRLADRLGEPLVAVHAVAPARRLPPLAAPGAPPAHATPLDEVVEDRRRHAGRLLRSWAPTAEHRVIVGAPAPTLVDVARAEDAELLVVGRGERGPLRELLRPSVATSVRDEAPCPVVVVPPDVEPDVGLRCVVCGVHDTDDGSYAAVEAGEIAARLGARLVLVHVVEPVPQPTPIAATAGVPVPVDELEAEQRMDGELLLEAARTRVGEGVPVSTRLELGDPGRRLDHVVDEEGADLLVVGCRGLGVFGSAVLGSVSTHLARRGHVPVAIAQRPH